MPDRIPSNAARFPDASAAMRALIDFDNATSERYHKGLWVHCDIQAPRDSRYFVFRGNQVLTPAGELAPAESTP